LIPTLAGVGIHGGRRARVRLHRDDGPLRFRVGGSELPADLGHVVGTDRCTVLEGAGVRLAVVEHLLAACHVLGFWSGLLVEVEGDELPILDGSAAPWAAALAELGPPPPAPPPLQARTAVRHREGASGVDIEPGDPTLEVSIAFAHPAIGHQRWVGRADTYDELLTARTFGFEDELAALQARGLVAGARTDSGILFTNEGIAVPLRSPDEPVRHKALDALGDFLLLGRPLAARVRVHRGSHRLHIDAMRSFLAAHSPCPPDGAA
jgi:UDP-3-O-[3-hydroxymyristoyl] N-acetylglucosamine deacetylase